MKKIFVAGKLLPKTEKQLQDLGAVFYQGPEPITEEALIEGVKDAHALICPLSTPVTEQVIRRASRLEIVANVGAGFDNINVAEAKARGIAVTNTPDVSTEATAELTLGLILSLMRRIPEGDQLLRETPEQFTGWAPTFFLGRELYGKTLGIIGLGRIGLAVAKRASAFGMRILYSGHQPKPAAETVSATFVTQEELIKASDVITIHAAYSPELKHLFDRTTLAQMKQSAFLINAARGPVVKEADLVEALTAGTISGAALDVFEFEPELSAKLRELQNVVLTPHIGNATVETREKMGEIAVSNIEAVLRGEAPLHSVY
ncbi:NAD(P)-dependent oxidoreductase [Listeria costaricensis]|uniref:NAD(P)-dependent oxidoreductase n=1 Tax=Listeria costaricensis TaxID=2026604 RepID=UPI000C08387C|nr:NAD(P)-dependent oxidoreductase [Listeria costaricensis]